MKPSYQMCGGRHGAGVGLPGELLVERARERGGEARDLHLRLALLHRAVDEQLIRRYNWK